MIETLHKRKHLGQVFTPVEVAESLVRWVAPGPGGRLLDPACGDGRFLAHHPLAVGVETDAAGVQRARQRAPHANIYEVDFFEWAADTPERFEAAAGNPPFIRYQRFSGPMRARALEQAARLGADFNGLTSAWAPFIVVTAGLLKPGGRLGFVVPAEIGHAPYARPVIETLCREFEQVRIVAIREKLFPHLSEDAWLLLAKGRGGSTNTVEFGTLDRFGGSVRNRMPVRQISLNAWRGAGCRLRRFLLSDEQLGVYEHAAALPTVARLGECARVGIGYITGANDFFHVRPSEARRLAFPPSLLRPSVRRARQLPPTSVTSDTVSEWLRRDEPILLLDLKGKKTLPLNVRRYLDSDRGRVVRKAYKCRKRDPWYAVPDVRVPDAFLTYMSGKHVSLVRNEAKCVCTNSLHAVFATGRASVGQMQKAWQHPLVELSCELEGHPLGGGMLKLEPREAGNVAIPIGRMRLSQRDLRSLQESTETMKRWRYHA